MRASRMKIEKRPYLESLGLGVLLPESRVYQSPFPHNHSPRPKYHRGPLGRMPPHCDPPWWGLTTQADHLKIFQGLCLRKTGVAFSCALWECKKGWTSYRHWMVTANWAAVSTAAITGKTPLCTSSAILMSKSLKWVANSSHLSLSRRFCSGLLLLCNAHSSQWLQTSKAGMLSLFHTAGQIAFTAPAMGRKLHH